MRGIFIDTGRPFVPQIVDWIINSNLTQPFQEMINMSSAEITAESLTKRYDVVALDNVSLAVGRGELFGLLGPNGAGKTTLINVLTGLTKPTSGSARVAGYDIKKDLGEVKGRIGVCPQEPAVYASLTGKENVELFGNLYAMPRQLIKKRSEELFQRMGLTQDAGRRAGRYSGGMKRRLSLVMAFINDPEIAFLDEPTVAMDPQSRRAVWDFIREIKNRHKTIVLTTHYMEEAQGLCDRVGVIDHGKLIALGTPKELMEQQGAQSLEEVFIQLTGSSIREE
jgi:ABC-2 type transport system ATP-binding protein